MYSSCTLGISKVYSTFLGLLVVTNMDSIESAGATNGSSWCLRGCRRGVLARATTTTRNATTSVLLCVSTIMCEMLLIQ